MDRNTEPETTSTLEQYGLISVLGLHGNITIDGGDVVLRERIATLFNEGRRCVLLDLTHVDYMDSCGLAQLVTCQRYARENDGEIKLLSPSARVRGLLAITKLDQVFDVFADEQAALAAFESCREDG